MKLAVSRDGRLLVVSRDLSLCLAVPGVAVTLEAALADWKAVQGELQEVYAALINGAARHAQPFMVRETCWPDADAFPLPAGFPAIVRLDDMAGCLWRLALQSDRWRRYAPVAVTADELTQEFSLRLTIDGRPAIAGEELCNGLLVCADGEAAHCTSLFGAIESRVGEPH